MPITITTVLLLLVAAAGGAFNELLIKCSAKMTWPEIVQSVWLYIFLAVLVGEVLILRHLYTFDSKMVIVGILSISVGFLFMVLMSTIRLHETLDGVQGAGVFVILCGIAMVLLGRKVISLIG